MRHKLREEFRDIPVGLHELFKDILTRGDGNSDEFLMCIQLTLFVERPLTPEELHYAILFEIEKAEPSVQQRSEDITSEIRRRFILKCSKGFVEATKLERPAVQFIHESVRDFLLKENGLRDLWLGNQSNIKGQSHERLKRSRAVHINNDILDDISPNSSLSILWSDREKLQESAISKFSFLKYAVQHVLYHADVAESDGVSEGDFIRDFSRQSWIFLHRFFNDKYRPYDYTPNANLRFIFAARNMANLLRSLIRSYPEKNLIFTATKEKYGPPILAALVTGSYDVVCAILES